ncbi:unnamed protein product [Lymnaea stagnalis]|uniref:Uncharacterized protein n=1 Tax=Lymnaea stagnalis TaxID=6523 RepID=A0AAV2HJG5_LYMST
MLLFAFMTLCYVRLKRRSQLNNRHVGLEAGGQVGHPQTSLESSGQNGLGVPTTNVNASYRSQEGGGGDRHVRCQASTVNQSASCSSDANYVRDLKDSRVIPSLASLANTAPVGIQGVLDQTGGHVHRGYTMDSPKRRARSKTDNRSISRGKSLSIKKSRIFSKWSFGAIKKRISTIKRQGKQTPSSNDQSHTLNARQGSAVHLRNTAAQTGTQHTFHQTKLKEASHKVQQTDPRNEASFRVVPDNDSHKLPPDNASPKRLNSVLVSTSLHKRSLAYNRDNQEKGMGSFNAITQNGNGRIKIKTDWSAFLTSVEEKLHKNPQQQKKSPKKSSPQRNASCQVMKDPATSTLRKIKKRGPISHGTKSRGRVQKVEVLKPNPKTSIHNAEIPKLVEAIKRSQPTDFGGEVTMGSYTIKKTTEPVLSSLTGHGAFSSYAKDGQNIFSPTIDARPDHPSVEHGDVSDEKDSILKEYRTYTRDSKPRSPLDNRQKLTLTEKFSRGATGYTQGPAHENIGRHNTKFLIERGQTSSNEINSLNGKSLGMVWKQQPEKNRGTHHDSFHKDLCKVDLSKYEYFTFKEVKLPSRGGESKPLTECREKARVHYGKYTNVDRQQPHLNEISKELYQEKLNAKDKAVHTLDFHGPIFGSANERVKVPTQPPNDNVKFGNNRDQLQFIASSNPCLQRTLDATQNIHKPSPTYLHHKTTVRGGDVSEVPSHPVTSNSKKPHDNVCHLQRERALKRLEENVTKMTPSKSQNLQFICVPHEKINNTAEVLSNQEHGTFEYKPLCKHAVENRSGKKHVTQDRRVETLNSDRHSEFSQNKPIAFTGLENPEQKNNKSKRGDNTVSSSFTIKPDYENMDTGSVVENFLAPNPRNANARDTNNEKECDEAPSLRTAIGFENFKSGNKTNQAAPFSFTPVGQSDTKSHVDQGTLQHRVKYHPDQTLHPIAESGDFTHLTKAGAVHSHDKSIVSVASTSDSEVTPGCFHIGHCYIKDEGSSRWTCEPSEALSDHVTKRAIFVQEENKHNKHRAEKLPQFCGDEENVKIAYQKIEVHRKENRRNKCQGYPVKKSKSLISVGQMVSELTSQSHQKFNPGHSPGNKTSSRKHTKVCKVIYVKPSHRVCRHVRVNTAPRPQPQPIFFKISNDDFLENRMVAYHEHEKKDDYVKYCKLRKVRCHRHEPYKKQLVTSSGSTSPPSGHIAYHKRNRNNCSPSRRGRFELGPKVDQQCFDDPPQQPQHNTQSDEPSSESFNNLQPNERESNQKTESDGFTTLRYIETADSSSGTTPLGVSEDNPEDDKAHRETHFPPYIDGKNMLKPNTDDTRKKWFYDLGTKGGNISSFMENNENPVNNEICLKTVKKSTENLRAFSKKKVVDMPENITHTCIIDKKTTAECSRNNKKRADCAGGNRITIGLNGGSGNRISNGLDGDSSNRKPLGLNLDPSNRIPIGLDGDSSYSDLKTEENNSHYLFGRPREKRQPSKSPPTTQSHMTQTESSNIPINIGVQTSPRLEIRPRKMLFQYKRKGYNPFPKSLRDKAKLTRKSKAIRTKYPCKNVVVQGDHDFYKNPVAQWLQDHAFVNWTHVEQNSHDKGPYNAIPSHETTRSQSSTLGTSDWASHSLQSHNVMQTITKGNINVDMRPGWSSHKTNSAVPNVRSKYAGNSVEEIQNATEHIGDCPDLPSTKEFKDKPLDCQTRTNTMFQFRGFSFDKRHDPALRNLADPTEAKAGIPCHSSSVPWSENSEDIKASMNRAPDRPSTSSTVHVNNTKDEASETSMTSSRLSELQKLCVIRPFWKNANIDEIDRRVKRALRLREELQMSRSACAQRRASAGVSIVGTSSVTGAGDVDNNAIISGGMMPEMTEETVALRDEVLCEDRNVPLTTGNDAHSFQKRFFKASKEKTRLTSMSSNGREIPLHDNKKKSPNSIHTPLNKDDKKEGVGTSISAVCRFTNVDKVGKVEKNHRLEPTVRLERSLSFHEDPVTEIENRPGKANSEHTSSRPSNSNSAQNTLKRVRTRDKNSPPTKISKVENALTSTPKLVGELVQSLPQVPLFSFVEWFIETSDPSNFVLSDHSSSSSGKDREERIFRDEVMRTEELGCLVKYHGRNLKLNQGSCVEGMPDTPSTATFAISSRTAEDQTTYDFESLTPTEGLSVEKRYGHFDVRLGEQTHQRSREVEDNSAVLHKCTLQSGDTEDAAPFLSRQGRAANLGSGYKFGENKDNVHTPFRFSMSEQNSTSTTDPSHSKSSTQDTHKTSESSVKTPTVHLAYDSYLNKKLHHPDNDTTSSAGTKTGDLSDLYNIYCNIRDNDDQNESSPKRESEWPVDSTEESVTEEVCPGVRRSQMMFSDDAKDDDADRCAPGIRHILMKLRQTKDEDDGGGPRHDRMRITLRKSSDVTGIIAKFQNENS